MKVRASRSSSARNFIFTLATKDIILYQLLKMSANSTKIRSIYRSLLRELPSRGLESRSPLQERIRTTLATNSTTPIEQAEQFLQYVKAQRMYATLLERYNPGMNMDEEERVRLTARRVGLDLPDEAIIPPKHS